MLDVHPPEHTPHTWRDFLIHIATIVLGLVIAIGLEQTVELIHQRREVAETRAALHLERDQNRAAFSSCMAEFYRQADALENNLLVLRYLQQHPGTPQEKLPGILLWHANGTDLSDSAWKTAQQSNVTALMPQDEVRRDAVFYERVDAVSTGFDQLWAAIIQARLYALENPDPSKLTPAQVAEEIDLTKSVMGRNFTWAASLVQLRRNDPGFTPALTPETLNRMMRISEAEKNPALASAIALTNTRLPPPDRLPIPR